MADTLIKALAFDGKVRVYATRTTDTISEAQVRHATWPAASAALGRTMTIALMMGSMLKGDAKLSVKVDGGGPIGAIIADANAKGEVRGYVTNPQTHLGSKAPGKLDVAAVVGTEGTLTIAKDLGLKEQFSGQVPLVSGEISEDFTYYFANSEQVPSSVGAGVLVNPDNSILAAGGFLIQLLPGTDDETITKIEDALSKMRPISSLVKDGYTPVQMVEEILGAGNVHILEEQPVRFQCQCSKERIENALKGLGPEELQDMIETDGQAEAECHFCNEKYMFTKNELETLERESR
ncbi:Hsp33 family molecular chaperone HslO [Bacillus fonticola]|uniref:Hsp33 family molecular chaperone HslO n=1 Tax=Bacillus fonticola TaxID=2728853 RepID=UPI001474DFF5|nr:Hsp33 family molecular chaperone HslO [Bacillus fonticola]